MKNYLNQFLFKFFIKTSFCNFFLTKYVILIKKEVKAQMKY